MGFLDGEKKVCIALGENKESIVRKKRKRGHTSPTLQLLTPPD